MYNPILDMLIVVCCLLGSQALPDADETLLSTERHSQYWLEGDSPTRLLAHACIMPQ